MSINYESSGKAYLEKIENRRFEDVFYHDFISTSLDFIKEILHQSKINKIYIKSITLGGSTSRGTLEYTHDLDILIISKNPLQLRKKINKIIQKYDLIFKEKFPQLTRENIVSVYIPRTPKNSNERDILYKKDPTELEIKTTEAEQIIFSNKKERKAVYMFQRKELKEMVNKSLEDKSSDVFILLENLKIIAMEKYNISKTTYNNSTIITEGRLCGVIFSEDKIEQSSIIEKRDKIFEEYFCEKMNQIYYYFKI